MATDTKTPKPPPGPISRRRLLAQEQVSSVAFPCLACAWRKSSNQGLKVLHATTPEFTTLCGENGRYDGFLFGLDQGSIVVAQFNNDRQVGFVAVAVEDFPAFVSEGVRVHQQYTAQLATEAGESDASAPDTSNDEDEYVPAFDDAAASGEAPEAQEELGGEG